MTFAMESLFYSLFHASHFTTYTQKLALFIHKISRDDESERKLYEVTTTNMHVDLRETGDPQSLIVDHVTMQYSITW